jgi:TRAP-type transport system periplasmic protein
VKQGIIRFGCIVTAMLGLNAAARAQETTLIFATINPANADTVTRYLQPWADRINAQGKGILHIDARSDAILANPGNFYDRVMSDVVQISWGTQSQVGGKFPLSDVVSLPFLTDKSETASVAFFRLYKAGLLDREYADVVPLWLYVYPQNNLHFAKSPKGLDNLNGLKVQAINKVNAQIASLLGAAPITLNIGEAYMALQRGTIDATIVPWPAFQPFKLDEVTTYHVEAPLGSGPGMMFMARKRYEALPAAARKILDANSGEAAARSWGAFLDTLAGEAKAHVQTQPQQKVVNLPHEQRAKWQAALASIMQEWATKTPGGENVLNRFREILAQVQARASNP